MTLGGLIAKDKMIPGSCWQLQTSVNGFAESSGIELATQVASGRSFELLGNYALFKADKFYRLKVRLLEDGYQCWLDFDEIIGRALKRGQWEPRHFSFLEIQSRIPAILQWVEQASQKKNKYLWGGTIGPDFDCSGLVQAAFASQEIWLPRDAYQMERFCQTLDLSQGGFNLLLPGDLLFFGTDTKCTHVGLYKASSLYWHSSGIAFGHNGIECDRLDPIDQNSVAFHYLSQIRSAGRVVCCHDGTTLP